MKALLLAATCAFAPAAVLAADAEPPIITHVRIANAPLGEPLAVRARIEDASEIFAPSVYVRNVGAETFDNLPMKKVENGFEAVIPKEQVARAIEYFIEAFDEHGNGPAREGSPDEPIRVLVFDPDDAPPPPPPPPGVEPPPSVETETDGGGGIATKWWFWTIIGVVVVGAVVGVVVGTRAGPVDEVDISVQAPDPTAGL